MAKQLCIHIGTGKAGSTAIQSFCSTHIGPLRQLGVHYWGLNLEDAPTTQCFPWQSPTGTSLLQRLSEVQASEQLRLAIEAAVDQLPDGATALWSNESIYERPNVYIPLLKSISAQSDVNLLVIAYARNHIGYLCSAYKQWGIKHKTYRGALLGFADWLTTRKDFLSYGKRLAIWDSAFADRFRLVNYNSTEDVVAHICRFLPADVAGLQRSANLTVNASPPDPLLALYAVYNNQSEEPVTPQAFTALCRRQTLLRGFRGRPAPRLRSLFPTAADLRRAEELLADDAALVNTMLRRHGQPPMADQLPPEPHPDPEQLSAVLLAQLMAVVVQQDARIQELQEQLSHSPTRAAQPVGDKGPASGRQG